MKAGRTIGYLLLLACVLAVGLGAADGPSTVATGDLSAVAATLGVAQEDGCYNLAQLLEAIVERLPDGEPTLIELVRGEPIRAGESGRLTFHTALGTDFVEYRIAVIYLGTQATAKASQLKGPPTGTDIEAIWWEWTCETGQTGQNAVAIVTASWGESGARLSQSFTFRVE